LIDRALEKAAALSGRRIVLLNRDGTILRDSIQGKNKIGDNS